MRNDNIEMLHETLAVFQRGAYERGGKTVLLRTDPDRRRQAIVLLPDDLRGLEASRPRETVRAAERCAYGCVNTDSFTAALRLSAEAGKQSTPVLVLNFANPVNPGGGVRYGARAQEEDLCRKSSLLLSLESEAAEAYYRYNRSLHTNMGSDALILTSTVEVIRDETGELLEEPVTVSVLTCAAPMITSGTEGLTQLQYRELLFRRITGLLKCAAAFGYDKLVLGAWGCGAFGNDAALMSDLFFQALKELRYCGMTEKDLFRRVEFAVLDRTAMQYNFRQFERNFTQTNFYRDEPPEKAERPETAPVGTPPSADKIRGCLFGGAAGDALGYAVEFRGEESIFSLYGPGGITRYELAPGRGEALISDDTQMTLFTANGLLVSAARATVGGVAETPYETVALAYQDWLCTQEMRETDRDRLSSDGRRHLCWLLDVPQLYSRRAPGNTCLSALYQQREGAAPGSTAHPLNTSKGCGGVMRVAPMGLLRFPGMDIRAADREGAELAALTHGHSLGYMPAAVLTHIIRRIVFPERALMLREIVREARDTAAELFAADPYIGRLTALLDLAVDLSGNGADDLENIHALGEGWVGEEALAIAVYCALRYQNDFSAGVIAAVNHRGDSDSTGAIAGNILGAWVGFDGIDVRWTDELELYDVILEIADDLCRAGGGDGSIDWKRKYL